MQVQISQPQEVTGLLNQQQQLGGNAAVRVVLVVTTGCWHGWQLHTLQLLTRRMGRLFKDSSNSSSSRSLAHQPAAAAAAAALATPAT
jgi:hypothetical protein